MNAKTLKETLFYLVPILSLVACGPSDPPVASLQVGPDELQLPFPGVVDLELSWAMELPLDGFEGQPLVFVHLVDEQGEVLRTFDHPLEFDWQPGQMQQYRIRLYQSALAPPLEPGTYGLTIGLYDFAGQRWPLRVDGREVGRNEYRVAEVEVEAESAAAPMFFFSPAWLHLESGVDRQVVARRWLSDAEGTIRVTDCPESGRIWMLVRIPGSETGASQVVLEDEASAPEVRITSTCGLEEICVSGPGFHEIEISLSPADKELLEECELRLQPNFKLVEEGASTQRSMALEVLAWAE
jgi:hypothetical protein